MYGYGNKEEVIGWFIGDFSVDKLGKIEVEIE